MAHLIDHLWQSILFVLLVAVLATLTGANSAMLRRWLWRIAAGKFLLPFSLLSSLGGWIGFPVRHTSIPPPAELLGLLALTQPWLSPAETFGWSGAASGTALAVALVASLLSGLWIRSRLEESEELVPEPAPLGMFKSTTLAAVTFALIAAPMLAGALHDRVRRQRVLRIDIEALRAAAITLTPVPSVFGGRTEIIATRQGVEIRHVNLQDLVALAYGIGQFEVFGGALPWLESPHYLVRVSGRVSEPEVFDPYSLREPVTKYLNQEFGVSIRVNGNCQEPCLHQESFVVERIPWTLMKKISGEK